MTLSATPAQPWSPVVPTRSAWHAAGIDRVTITGGYWGHMQDLNASTMLPHCHAWMERVGWINNLRMASDARLPVERQGREFSDSDVYKLLEAMAWELARKPDSELQASFDEIVDVIARAQEPDGYINTQFGRAGQAPRYTDLAWGHELYNYGHLLQAAVAYGRTGGSGPLLDVARRVADHVCVIFGKDGFNAICGHPEIEVALVEFSRLTGDRRYLDQAALFLERRGHGLLPEIEFGRSYYQDSVPIREATTFVGHAVRATYLAAAAVDAGVELEDDGLVRAVIEQITATLARRTYITGGMGAHHEGESFGSDFELPSERAYSETCAGVGAAMVYHRLLLATGQAIYADHWERVMFNVVCASPAHSGDAFFYTNTLHRREQSQPAIADEPSPRANSGSRAPWFAVSCCPTNVSRTISQLGSAIVVHSNDEVRIAQFVNGVIDVELDGGVARLDVTTDYPVSGDIDIRVLSAPTSSWRLAIRVPKWSAEVVLTLDDGSRHVRDRPQSGWLSLDGLSAGSRVRIALDMSVRTVAADSRVDAVRGQVAVERGPQVYCAEALDGEWDLERVQVVGSAEEADGLVCIPAELVETVDQSWPFSSPQEPAATTTSFSLPLLPYADWGNRGPSTMRVWLPRRARHVGK